MRFPLISRRFVLSLVAPLFVWTALPASAGEPVEIFNGKDLTGWTAPMPNDFWKAENGVITGTNNEKLKGAMLWTEKEYGDFELEAEAKWEGEIDSGFMLRKPELQLQIGISRSLKTDMTGCFYTGKYPEEGQAKDRAKLLKPGDWNHFKIRAEGTVFTVWINGTEAVKYVAEKYAGPAPIGLQIHQGLKMSVAFRNLKVKEL